MKVEELKNYGKNILEMSIASMPADRKVRVLKSAVKLFVRLTGALGVRRTIGLMRKFKKNLKDAGDLDWSDLKARGVSQKDLDMIIKKTVLNKTIADMIGMDRLEEIRFAFSASTSYDIMEEMFASAATFMACGNGDFLDPFKRYYVALMDRMAGSGIEDFEVARYDKDVFQLNVTYCAFYEAAKKLGDPYLCYITSCHGDETFFGKLSEDAGFEYHREGTLALGKPVCDHCFKRKI